MRAENETRTRDPNLGKVVLYQLSYFRFSISGANILQKQYNANSRAKNSEKSLVNPSASRHRTLPRRHTMVVAVAYYVLCKTMQ